MQLKTLLNKVDKFSSFYIKNVKLCNEYDKWVFRENSVVVEYEPRSNSKPICSKCNKPGTCYDHLDIRLFDYPPIWIFNVNFAYRMRRVDCLDCGVTVETVPWASGKENYTKTYKYFIAEWAKKLSWKEVANSFRTSSDTVFRCVESAVEWGLKHRDLTGIKSIGVDEVARKRGHVYATLVYQIDEGKKRLLWIGKERKEDTLRSFFEWFGTDRRPAGQFAQSSIAH